MNKFLLFPLGFMLIISLIGMWYNPSFSFSGQSDDWSSTPGGYNNTTVNVPGASPVAINLNSSTTILALLLGAIAVGIAGGVSILGSGLSGNAQNVLFNSVIFLGLWGVLSLFGASVIFNSNDAMLFLWIVLTIIFVIGLASHISEGGASGSD